MPSDQILGASKASGDVEVTLVRRALTWPSSPVPSMVRVGHGLEPHHCQVVIVESPLLGAWLRSRGRRQRVPQLGGGLDDLAPRPQHGGCVHLVNVDQDRASSVVRLEK
ncbi:hypothetical protein [Knoellia koreensis]|jgi:hypothetical protein|uniref:Uncharacterized protein n=1 Tax=Knoellia koreensis TaxID=2730921 RepID=A0A849HK82_9MICO|nr:hypothetical protein [Knoellia sp. DB2414S]NNM46944.1 hypothetical protein [Knoellia sp. DB2414S]